MFDQWKKEPPYTDKQLRDIRSRLLKYLNYTPTLHGGITCDKCEGKAACRLAYDAYNTNGDCLLEK
jgi:MoaA/NifB/PqqE/SkfB family radical SAM enzyme